MLYNIMYVLEIDVNSRLYRSQKDPSRGPDNRIRIRPWLSLARHRHRPAAGGYRLPLGPRRPGLVLPPSLVFDMRYDT